MKRPYSPGTPPPAFCLPIHSWGACCDRVIVALDIHLFYSPALCTLSMPSCLGIFVISLFAILHALKILFPVFMALRTLPLFLLACFLRVSFIFTAQQWPVFSCAFAHYDGFSEIMRHCVFEAYDEFPLDAQKTYTNYRTIIDCQTRELAGVQGASHRNCS